MGTRLAIRPGSPADLESAFSVQKAASIEAFGHVFPPERYPFPAEAVRERWQTMLADPGARVVVAEVSDVFVGVASVRPEWLDALYVLPACWGTGAAGRLHDHAIELLRGLGSKRAHLWVLEENPRGRRFYERRGWHQNGRTRVVPFPPNPLDVGYTLELR
jgi:GNAT superfamily N-acetyltransferase